MDTKIKKHGIEIIAPCGMNCSLCIAYQFREKDLNKKGFHRTYCPGCMPRGKNCTHMADSCELLGNGLARFCFECENYPCKRLKALDKRYRTKYHMSMIENLDYIKEHGVEEFLKMQEEKWQCLKCGGVICCHNGLCLDCELDKFLENKKYRWDELNTMNKYTKTEIEKTLQIIKSTIANCQKIQPKFPKGTSQHTLLENRIKALMISSILITNDESREKYNVDELTKALVPINSIIKKCEKAQQKFLEGSAFHTRFKNIIQAMEMSKTCIEEEINKRNLL